MILLLTAFTGCSVTRKLSAADILSKTNLELKSFTLDSVVINKDLFPKAEGLAGLLPNPQVVALVQDFAKGILEKELGTIGLSAEIIAKNQGTDTLWIRSLQASLTLDSIMDLPIALKDSVMMVPGDNSLEVSTTFPIDKRIFKLKDISKISMKGILTVSLDADGEPVPLNFDIERPVSHEEIVAITDKARNSILNVIINNWVGALGL